MLLSLHLYIESELVYAFKMKRIEMEEKTQKMTNNEKWKMFISHEKPDQPWEPYDTQPTEMPIENLSNDNIKCSLKGSKDL